LRCSYWFNLCFSYQRNFLRPWFRRSFIQLHYPRVRLCWKLRFPFIFRRCHRYFYLIFLGPRAFYLSKMFKNVEQPLFKTLSYIVKAYFMWASVVLSGVVFKITFKLMLKHRFNVIFFNVIFKSLKRCFKRYSEVVFKSLKRYFKHA